MEYLVPDCVYSCCQVVGHHGLPCGGCSRRTALFDSQTLLQGIVAPCTSVACSGTERPLAVRPADRRQARSHSACKKKAMQA